MTIKVHRSRVHRRWFDRSLLWKALSISLYINCAMIVLSILGNFSWCPKIFGMISNGIAWPAAALVNAVVPSASHSVEGYLLAVCEAMCISILFYGVCMWIVLTGVAYWKSRSGKETA